MGGWAGVEVPYGELQSTAQRQFTNQATSITPPERQRAVGSVSGGGSVIAHTTAPPPLSRPFACSRSSGVYSIALRFCTCLLLFQLCFSAWCALMFTIHSNSITLPHTAWEVAAAAARLGNEGRRVPARLTSACLPPALHGCSAHAMPQQLIVVATSSPAEP